MQTQRCSRWREEEVNDSSLPSNTCATVGEDWICPSIVPNQAAPPPCPQMEEKLCMLVASCIKQKKKGKEKKIYIDSMPNGRKKQHKDGAHLLLQTCSCLCRSLSASSGPSGSKVRGGLTSLVPTQPLREQRGSYLFSRLLERPVEVHSVSKLQIDI